MASWGPDLSGAPSPVGFDILRMSTTALTVSYNHHRVKVPYKASTVLKDVRDQACQTLSLDATGFGLKHAQKQLELSLPFRYSNLVDNAHVDLVKLAAATGAIRVKVRVPGKNDFVDTFDASENLVKIAAAAGVDHLVLGGQPVSGSLGSVANGSVMFTGQINASSTPQLPQKSSHVAKHAPTTSPISAPSAASPTTETRSKPAKPSAVPPQKEELGGRQVQVILPASANTPKPTDDEPELTESQFRTYHKYLRDQAGARPMLSKSTREKIAQERRQKVSHTTVRVRLPDQTHLQAVFTSEEKTDVLYDFIRSHLRDPLQEFYLTAVDGPGKIELGKSLVTDYKFGSRILLIFKWTVATTSKSPTLSDATLKLVSQPADLPQNSSAGSPAAKPAVQPAQKEPEAKSKHKTVPKWLKLHK